MAVLQLKARSAVQSANARSVRKNATEGVRGRVRSSHVCHASWRSSGSPAAGGLSVADLGLLRIDDLSEISKKKGVSAGRTPTKDSLLSALVAKGVTLADLSRGQLADLATKLGKPLAKDAEGLRRNLAGVVGGGYTPAPSAPASTGGRFAAYSPASSRASSPSAASRGSSPAPAAGSLGVADLSVLKIDDLAQLARKKGVTAGRTPTKDSLISALAAKGVSPADLTRGMLADLSSKRGSSVAAAAPTGGRFASYSPASSRASSPSASWRSSSPAPATAGGSLSTGDLSALKIDDLQQIARTKGVTAGRAPTKSDLINALAAKGVSLTDLTRGMLVDLATKLGKPLAKDIEGLRASLSGALGSSAPVSRSSSPAPAAASTDRFASYAKPSNGNGSSASSWRTTGSSASPAAGGNSVLEQDLAGFKIDELTTLAKKKGVDTNKATRDTLTAGLLRAGLSLSDLSKGQLVDILSKIGQPISGTVEVLRTRAAAAVDARRSARQLAPARR